MCLYVFLVGMILYLLISFMFSRAFATLPTLKKFGGGVDSMIMEAKVTNLQQEWMKL